MSDGLPYERMLQECLKGELKLMKSGLPRNRKTLFNLLHEEYPRIVCGDGGTQLFKRRELKYLASMVNVTEQEALLLPMIMELGENQAEATVMCQGEMEGKVISKVLAMPVTREQGRIRIYKPQLALLTKTLKTTTQYVFSLKFVA